MISSSFSADEVRAAAETHRELPPEYQAAVIDSFLSKVDREIDAETRSTVRNDVLARWQAPIIDRENEARI